VPRFFGRLLVLACFMPLVAYARDDSGADFERMQRSQAASADRLATMGTADALAAAALLKQFRTEGDAGSYALVARAVELAPTRPDLAWLAIRLCDSAPDCDSAGPEQHLRSLDPSNAVGWMGALKHAQAVNDAKAVDATLSAIAGSKRFYVYFEPLVAATAPELAVALHAGPGKPRPKEISLATVQMIGVLAATVLPPSQAFSSSCKGNALELPGRLEYCRLAAQTFERSDTYITEGLGLSLQQRLWPLDSPEGRAITERRRVFQYRLETYSRLSVSSSKPDEAPADFLDVLRGREREQDVALVYFVKAGIPVDPPKGWASANLPRVP
jgi:hypothetical protein